MRFNYFINNRLFIVCAIIVFFITTYFRLFQLASIPPSLNPDEVAFGYNAYSILKTGRDEFGTLFPIYFRSYDDNKMPALVYLTVGSLALFGANEFGVRFPSAFLGILTVLLTGLLTWSICKNKWIALTASFLLSVLPWHVQYSRIALDPNVGLFFLVLASYVFIYSIKNNPQYVWVSVVIFFCAAFSYLSSRVLSVILLTSLFILFMKNIRIFSKKHLIVLAIILTLFYSILFLDAYVHNIHVRFHKVNIFNSPQLFYAVDQNRKEYEFDTKALHTSPYLQIVHTSQFMIVPSVVVHGYLSHFDPQFLFTYSNKKQPFTPLVGLCYLFMLPLLIVGIYYVTAFFRSPESYFILLWLITAPIPASVTWDIPHPIRSLNMVIPLVILASFGLYGVFRNLKKHNVMRVVFGIVMLTSIIQSVIHFNHQYTVHLSTDRSQDWAYGRKQMVEYITENRNMFDRIVISSHLYASHIYILFHAGYDPLAYLRLGGTKSGIWNSPLNSFDTYEFGLLSKTYPSDMRILYIGRPHEFKTNSKSLYTIYYLDGTPAIFMTDDQSNVLMNK